MTINWFPGHMHKATKEIKQLLPKVDLIVEVVDARVPYSSSNPVIAKFRQGKPSIKVLNKRDLADEAMTQKWIEHFEQDETVTALAMTTHHRDEVLQIQKMIEQRFPEKLEELRPIHVMITGIPNVGKSTIINIVAGRNIAKTGNEPAVTKGQQKIHLENNIYLWDTPGILWGKFVNQNAAYRLATTGAIKETAVSNDDIAAWAAEYLTKAHPDLLSARYQLDPCPTDEIEFLETVGRQRGCLAGGGRVDFEKVGKLFLTELRDGVVGRITLESPQDMIDEEAWIAEKLAEAEREAQENPKSKKKKKRR